MKSLKSLIAVILIAVISLSLVSCEKKVDENEAKELVKNLVSESYDLNEILYGEGLSYLEYESQDKYAPVEPNEKYLTLFSLKEKMREVYSSSYATSLIDYLFTYHPPVYGEGIFPRYEERGGYIVVLKDYEPKDITEYNYDTIEIKRIKRKEIKATVMSTENEAVEIVLVKESDGWRLDSATL